MSGNEGSSGHPRRREAQPLGGLPGGALEPATWFKYLMLVIVAAAFVNAALFIGVATNPLIAGDAWYFLDAFVREVAAGTLDLGDFLVKRAGLYHAQPLNKLVLLFHYWYFDLDFTVEAYVGLLFAFAGFAVIYQMASRDVARDTRAVVFYACMAAIAAVYVSLNSSMIFSSPLVTLAYMALFLALAAISGGWLTLNGRSLGWVGVPFGLLGVAADNVAIIAAPALLAAVGFYGWRMRQTRRAVTIALMIVGLLVATRVFLEAFGHIRGETLADFNVSAAQKIQGLWAGLGDWPQWLLIPAAASIAYMAQLKNLFGSDWAAAQLVLGMVVLLAQVWFWIGAWKSRPSSTVFAAVCIMLVMYGLWAGMLYGRVFVRGAEYLHQPRYVLFYQLNIVALLLMAIARSARPEHAPLEHAPLEQARPEQGAAGRAIIAGIAVLLIAVQIPLSVSSWTGSRFQLKYYQRMAGQLQQLAQHPGAVPDDCVPLLSVCLMPAPQRVMLVRFLAEERLNLFSARFRARHPELEAAGINAAPPK